LDHQLSKSPGARRRASRPASLIPPSPSHPEGTLPLSTSPSSRVPRVSEPARATSRLVPCPQRPVPSRSDGASPPSGRIPCSSHRAKAGERRIPRLASRPKGREWSAKASSDHAHCKKRGLSSGECPAISGERAVPHPSCLISSRESRPISGECHAQSASDALKSPPSRSEAACRPSLKGVDNPIHSPYYMYIIAVCPEVRSKEPMAFTDRGAPPSPKASSPRRGIPGRRRRFFDNRCTRGNGSGAVPSGLPYSGGRRCGQTRAKSPPEVLGAYLSTAG
jgi:hypothetical protein